jgi:hypothetical protein
VTIIATDTFELFTTLLHVPTIGNRLCEQYPQLIAKEKFFCINVITSDGCINSYLNSVKHSFNDQPASKHKDGYKYWYRYGEMHRKDLPAFKSKDGYKSWYWNGERHRENDLPAIVWPNGKKEWYHRGIRHRGENKTTVEYANGTCGWY